jgi:simple sugar transport system ATP-binding protein
VPAVTRPAATPGSAPRLEVCALSRLPDDPFGVALDGISLQVRGGEVIGIAGISGNGQAELLAALSGATLSAPGRVRIDGRDVGHLGIAARRDRGLAYVPEDRLGTGAAPNLSLADNGLLTAHRAGLVRRGCIDRGRRDAFARQVIADYDVRCSGAGATARQLSGGNLQKFIVGRELAQAPGVLLVAQPTWGVDVAAAAFLRQQLVTLSRRGAAVLVISEELDELFEICDALAVIHAGRLSAPQPVAQAQRDAVGLLMAGA